MRLQSIEFCNSQQVNMEEIQRKLDFIKNVLPRLIIESNNELRNCIVVSCSADDDTKTDGFMSSIFKVILVLEDENLR